MPKVGMEPIRRAALIDATIAEVGAQGSLDVTVSRIAGRAGVSAALAHHYFGGKEQIFLAAMRHILTRFGQRVREETAPRPGRPATPLTRLHGIVRASFGQDQFEDSVISSWLAFYALAQNSPGGARLLNVYTRRLRSNLLSNLRPLAGEARARTIAEGIAALIDGLYIRHALNAGARDRRAAQALVMDYLTLSLTPEARR